MSQGKKQQQHVDIFRKRGLRKRLLRNAVAGAAYVPFVGDGDIAAELYADRHIYGADLDPARVAVAGSRLTGDIITADCDGWPFPDADQPVAVADFDAHSYPYASFRAWWDSDCPRADRVVCFFTCGGGRPMNANGACLDFRTRTLTPTPYRAYSLHVRRVDIPALTEYVKPWRVSRVTGYRRHNMYYWGCVLEK